MPKVQIWPCCAAVTPCCTAAVNAEHVEFEDTINVEIAERVRLRIVANNPGDWMAHCHILPHAETGMMTVLRVE